MLALFSPAEKAHEKALEICKNLYAFMIKASNILSAKSDEITRLLRRKMHKNELDLREFKHQLKEVSVKTAPCFLYKYAILL